MATTQQRKDIATAEALAALLDAELERVGLLALQPELQRRNHLMAELEQAAVNLVAARAHVIAWRRRLQEEAQ